VDIPRENAFRNGLSTIREALGDTYLLTCGTPILPSLGLCDGIRIGPDAAVYYTSRLGDTLLMNFAFPGGRNVVRTTLNRLWLKELVHIDPDVVYFTSRQNSLSHEQKSLLQNLAQICNFKGSSDIPSWLTEAERLSLHEFLETTPEIRRVGRTTFQIDDHLVDYESYIDMPALPDRFMNILGAIISRLADLPFVMRVFDFYTRLTMERRLKQNPL
jgi:alpha-galactosidase